MINEFESSISTRIIFPSLTTLYPSRKFFIRSSFFTFISIIATHPQEVGANVCYQAGHIIVATIEDTVALSERCQPLVGGDVVAKDAKPLGSDVGDIPHDLNHGITRLGALAPVVVVLEVGFRDEANA